MSKPYAVNADGAVFREGEYLLIERSKDEEHAAGKYGLPGGTVEAEQSDGSVLEDALHREVREEVGLSVTDLEYVESTAFVADTGESCINVIFLCRHESGEAHVADVDEVEAVEWLTVEEVRQHNAIEPWTRRNIEEAEEVRTDG